MFFHRLALRLSLFRWNPEESCGIFFEALGILYKGCVLTTKCPFGKTARGKKEIRQGNKERENYGRGGTASGGSMVKRERSKQSVCVCVSHWTDKSSDCRLCCPDAVTMTDAEWETMMHMLQSDTGAGSRAENHTAPLRHHRHSPAQSCTPHLDKTYSLYLGVF